MEEYYSIGIIRGDTWSLDYSSVEIDPETLSASSRFSNDFHKDSEP